MARFVFGMQVSLDGFVDHDAMAPDAVLFRHWIEVVRGVRGSLYGRKLYEIMRYWDDEHPEWSDDEREFAEAWRAMPKWVVSRSLKEVGPNATLLGADTEAEIRALKDREAGEIDVGGPVLAAWLSKLGLIDEYRLYKLPKVLERGAPFFAGPPPELRLAGCEPIGAEAVRLSYVPV